jgi:hypothetical protein
LSSRPERIAGFLLLAALAGCAALRHGGPESSLAPPSRYAIYYGHAPVYEALDRYDWVIVADDFPPERLSRTRYFAYLSIGEIDRDGPIRTRLEHRVGHKAFRKILLAKNDAWRSWVADIRNPAFRKILLEQADRDRQNGYRGLFLDTLDSPLAYETDHPVSGKGLARAIVTFIRELRRRHPRTPLVVNRGFAVLPRIARDVSGVLFEDFCSMYDETRRRYVFVPADTRNREMAKVRDARRENPSLVVLALDYGFRRDIHRRERCADMAREKGFVPYFAVRNLDTVP